MCRPRKWFAGLIPLFLLFLIALNARTNEVRQDLAARATLAVQHEIAPGAKVAIQGRDAYLSGTINDESAQQQAVAVAESTWGVRRVLNGLELSPAIKPYKFSTTKSGDGIVLEGFAPNAQMKAELGKAALALSPKVDNRLQIARGAPNGFLDMARSGFAPLAQLVRGQATLVDDVLTVTGVAADNDKRQGAFAATQNLPKGVRLGGVKIEGPLGPTAQEAEAIRVKAEAERLAAVKAEADRLAADRLAAEKAAADKAAAAKAEADRLAAEKAAAEKAAAAKAEADRLAAEKAAADKAAAAKAEADRLAAEKAAADKAAAAKAEADRLAAEKAAAEKAAAERLAAEKAAAEKAIADKAAAKSAPYKAPAAQIQQGGCVRPASGALLAGRVLFASGSARLNEEGQQVAHEIATMLKACSQFSVEVRGYTDSVGDAESNQRLARRRANALLNALTEQGVAKTRFVAESYGEGNPIGDNDTEEGRAQNRRIEILVK